MRNQKLARQEMMLKPETSAMIRNLRILVVGVGAGGNDLLKNLVLMGFGNITVVDFDYVEDSNLAKSTLFREEDIGKSKALVAAERLREVALHDSPNIKGIHGNLIHDIGKGVFLDHDIVICCVDTLKARAYINDWCVRTNTPFFEMGFAKYDVNITFFAPEGRMIQKNGSVLNSLPSTDGTFPAFEGEFPVCLRETIPNGFGEIAEKRNHCAGLRVRDVNLRKTPTIQAAAAMAGALISTELVKYLDGQDCLRNKKLFYDGMNHEMFTVSYKRNDKCPIHKEEKLPIIDCVVQKDATVREVISSISKIYNGSDIIITMPEIYSFSGQCQCCGKSQIFNRRKSLIFNDERWCSECREKYPDDYEIRLNFPFALKSTDEEISQYTDEEILGLKLCEIGIPENDILKVLVVNGMKYIYVHIINI